MDKTICKVSQNQPCESYSTELAASPTLISSVRPTFDIDATAVIPDPGFSPTGSVVERKKVVSRTESGEDPAEIYLSLAHVNVGVERSHAGCATHSRRGVPSPTSFLCSADRHMKSVGSSISIVPAGRRAIGSDMSVNQARKQSESDSRRHRRQERYASEPRKESVARATADAPASWGTFRKLNSPLLNEVLDERIEEDDIVNDCNYERQEKHVESKEEDHLSPPSELSLEEGHTPKAEISCLGITVASTEEESSGNASAVAVTPLEQEKPSFEKRTKKSNRRCPGTDFRFAVTLFFLAVVLAIVAIVLFVVARAIGTREQSAQGKTISLQGIDNGETERLNTNDADESKPSSDTATLIGEGETKSEGNSNVFAQNDNP